MVPGRLHELAGDRQPREMAAHSPSGGGQNAAYRPAWVSIISVRDEVLSGLHLSGGTGTITVETTKVHPFIRFFPARSEIHAGGIFECMLL